MSIQITVHTNGFSGKDSRKEASISVPALEFPSLCESLRINRAEEGKVGTRETESEMNLIYLELVS